MDGTFIGVCIATFVLIVGGIACGAMEWNELSQPAPVVTVTLPDAEPPDLLMSPEPTDDGSGEVQPEAVPTPGPAATGPDAGAVAPEPPAAGADVAPAAGGGGVTPEPAPDKKPEDGADEPDPFEWD
jgi:hypothetical protein